MRIWISTNLLIALLSLSSCATTIVDAYIPPDPILVKVPEQSGIEREKALEANLKKMYIWGSVVKKANKS